MKVLFLMMTLLAGTVCSAEPTKMGCHCTDCACTEKSNCGCFSKEGCGSATNSTGVSCACMKPAADSAKN